MNIAGPRQAGFAHRASLDTGHTTRDTDDQTGRHDAAALIPFLNEGLDHLLGGVEISDDAIAQRAHRADVSRGAAQHQLGLVTHREGHTPLQVNRHDGGFLQNDPLAADVHQGVRRPEINADVAGELETFEEHRRPPFRQSIGRSCDLTPCKTQAATWVLRQR